MRAKWGEWAISAIALLVAAVVLWQVKLGDGAVVRFDEEMAAAAKEHAQHHPQLLEFARAATHAGDSVVVALIPILTTVLLLRRHPRLAVIWVLATVVAVMMIRGGKEWVGRPRPGEALRDEAVQERNPSFPSGHALGSVVGYGGLAYVGFFVLRRRWTKVALAGMTLLFVSVIGWTRVYLRAHWVSDVVAGWALGIFTFSFCIAVVRTAWREKPAGD